MPEHPTDAHFSFTFVFKQALNQIIGYEKLDTHTIVGGFGDSHKLLPQDIPNSF